ncbi:MAG: hypothetical protein DRR08_01860 [Candidatus Parabeggiatoa sp. nov. 2]|nr:MAG: hypothetical protein DRR08_01860 [Gammaproteobacteria bacterium]
MKFYQRIRTKLAFGLLLVALIPAVTIGIYAMQTSIDALRERELNIQAEIVSSLKHDIETFLASTQKDLNFLSQSQPLGRYLNRRSTKEDSQTLELTRLALEEEFLAFSRSRGIYYQIRYLDENGQEVVRVDANNHETLVIPPPQLQNQAHRYYFTETMQLYEGGIFVSPLELNRERDQIEIPYKPVIRYATPVYYPDGHRAGIIITNVDANQFLQLLGNALLVSKDGYYLAHPDVNKRWGGPHDLKSGHTLTQDYPQFAPTLFLATQLGNISTKQLTLTFQRVIIPKLGHWILITQRPTDEVLHSINTFRITFGIILVVAVIISLLIALFINKIITTPIENLTHIVEQVRAGNRHARAEEVERVDELGTLGKGFNAMLEAIDASEETLQRTQQEAKAANIAKSRFLANMSHELRTPLNAIIGYGEMLQEEIEALGEAELSSDIEKIYLAGKHLLGSINDILDISKIEAGRMELYTETFYLPSMLDDIVHTIQPLLTKNQDTLEIRYSEGLGEMHTDLTKLRQILLKLLSNASKFNETKDTISLEARRKAAVDGKDWIIFRVQDNGIGMDDEQKQQLFKNFSQADMSTTRKYGGTGLGLAITNHFVQMMGGVISVDSELGKGSTFTVRLPAKVASTGEPKPSHTEVAMLEEGGIVLVIDDDAGVRDMLQKYLSKLGYQVEIADSGEKGLRLAKKVLPDIITLDVMMPKMDGWEVLSHLKADPQLAHIPVIMLSMIEDKAVGYSLGASDYLIKPITREQLSKVLQKYHFSQNESARLIMVIDDEPVNRDMLARMLRKGGFRVCKVEDARVALNYIQKKRPDLILLDLQMPEMDGFEFAARLHQVYDSIPIIVLTAKDITLEDRLRLNENVASIFQKGSYTREELLAQVGELLSVDSSYPSP